jgi:opacity protein-like surface antigen
MPAFQPYRGKPAVRNDRGDRGNVGIIRSPVRASILPDYTTVTGRIGYAVDRSLFYVKGGAAWTRGTVDMFVNQNPEGVFTSTSRVVTPGWALASNTRWRRLGQ